jgi:hypothetical protein
MTSKNIFKYRLLSLGVLAISFFVSNIALTGSDIGIGVASLIGSAYMLCCCWGCIHLLLTIKEARTYDGWRIAWVVVSAATLLYTVAIAFHQMYVVRRIG